MSDFGVEQHRELADDSAIWIRTGRRLLASADVLWVEVDKHFTVVSEILQVAKDVRPGDPFSFDEERLKESLKEYAQHASSFRLLAGYAIENFLKAVQVRRRVLAHGRATDDDGTLSGIRRDHDYEAFALQEFGKTALDVAELHLLRRLSEAVLWAGRYPLGNKPIDMTTWMFALGSSEDDRAQVHEFAERIIKLHDSLG